MAVTLADIATRVGVDVSTVSIVLNDRPKAQKLLKETRQRILNAALEMNYRSSFTAKALASGKTSTLGLVCGGIDKPYFAELASTALEQAAQLGYHMLISVVRWEQEEERKSLQMLLSRQVDGVLLHTGCLSEKSELCQQLEKSNYPIVMLNLPQRYRHVSEVYSDFTPGMIDAITHLKSLGHEQIHMVEYTRMQTQSVAPKTVAFYKSCEKLNVKPSVSYCDLDMKDCVKTGRRLAKSSHQALIVYSDDAAIGVINGLLELGRDVPGDIDVMGIDGTQWSQMYNPSLACIAQDSKQLIAHSLDILLKKIKNPKTRCSHITVPTYFRMGRSVGIG